MIIVPTIDEMLEEIKKFETEAKTNFQAIHPAKYYNKLAAFSLAYKPDLVIELGTDKARSAKQLAAGAKKVVTYDIKEDKSRFNTNIIETVRLKKPEDCLDIDFSEADLIFVDIDHSGKYEKLLHQKFIDDKVRGFAFWDDISPNNIFSGYAKWFIDLNHNKKAVHNWHIEGPRENGFAITRYC